MGAENRVMVPSTMAILVGSPGMSEEVPSPRPRCLWQLPRATPGLKNQYLCPGAHLELTSRRSPHTGLTRSEGGLLEGAGLKLEAEISTAQWGLVAAARAWPGPDWSLRMLGYRMGIGAGWLGERAPHVAREGKYSGWKPELVWECGWPACQQSQSGRTPNLPTCPPRDVCAAGVSLRAPGLGVQTLPAATEVPPKVLSCILAWAPAASV